MSIRNCSFGYQCNKDWDDLIPLDRNDVKFCDLCREKVYFCKAENEIIFHIKKNNCIAFQSEHDFDEILVGKVASFGEDFELLSGSISYKLFSEEIYDFARVCNFTRHQLKRMCSFTEQEVFEIEQQMRSKNLSFYEL